MRKRTCKVHAVRSDQVKRRPASDRHAQRRAFVVRHAGVDETGAGRQIDDDVRLGVERRYADRLLRRDAICRVPRQRVVVGARRFFRYQLKHVSSTTSPHSRGASLTNLHDLRMCT